MVAFLRTFSVANNYDFFLQMCARNAYEQFASDRWTEMI